MPPPGNATLLFLDLPKGALVAIDLFAFQAAPNTRGVTNLPSGFHFVFAASHESTASRQGFWFHTTGSEVIAKRWDPTKEELISGATSQQDLRDGRVAGLGLDDKVVPYSVFTEANGVGHAADDWQQLTSHISVTTMSRILGESTSEWKLASTSSAVADLEAIPGLTSALGKALQIEQQLNFVPVNLKKRVWRDGATGRERTEAALDHSWYLEELLTENLQSDANEMLGELQFCFLMVLLLNNWSCLEQWKRLLGLLFTCRAAVARHGDVYVELCKLLKTQLDWCATTETDIFDLNDEGKSFFVSNLRGFRDLVNGVADGRVKSKVTDTLDDLEEYLESKFEWDFQGTVVKRKVVDFGDGEEVGFDFLSHDVDDELGEYAPTVVDLTPEQLRMLTGEDAIPRTMDDLTIKAQDESDLDEGEEDDDLEAMDSRY